MIDDHDLGVHGEHLTACRQCRLEKAIYALSRAEVTYDNDVQVPWLGEKNVAGGEKWTSARKFAEALKETR